MRLRLPVAVSSLATVAFAAGTSTIASNVNSQLTALVELIRSIVPIIALGLFVLAGLVYAIGQVFDAQTRQKAQSWAMAMIVGGIIGVLIVIIAPWLVDFLLGFSS
jgi:hypothetical protein